MKSKGIYVSLVLAGVILLQANASGNVLNLQHNIAEEILSETVPTAFAVNDYGSEDFSVEWLGSPLEGVHAEIVPGTLQWVRVSEMLVLPRARLAVSARNIVSGRVLHNRFSTPFITESGLSGHLGHAELPVALISGEQNAIEVIIRPSGHMSGQTAGQRAEVALGQELRGKLQVRFKPRDASPGPRVFYDTSCSKFGIELEAEGYKPKDPNAEWIYIGCRFMSLEALGHRTSGIDLFLFWDNVGQAINIEGVDTPSSSVSVWPLRLRSKPGYVTLKAGSHKLVLRYQTVAHFRTTSLSAGVGPYSFSFQGPNENISGYAPILTLYGSYFFSDTLRFVAFDATTLNSRLYTDFGIYLHNEYGKVVDRRISIGLLLGGHVIGFKSGGTYYVKPGAPQGFELVVYDVFKRAYNFSFGAFLYPPIDGKMYNNVWLRWGKGQVFAELNYISWSEQVEDAPFHSRSFGLSIGFPVAKFF